MKTNFTKRLLDASRQVLLACVMISAIGISDAAAQTCTVESNTTMDPDDCTVVILATSLATGDPSVIFHTVTLEQAASGISNAIDPVISVDGASVTISTPGSYKYQIDDASGCWGTFNVEDKSGPTCEVPDGPTTTNDTDDYGTKRDDLRLEMIDCNTDERERNQYFDVLEEDDFDDCTGVKIGSVYFVDDSIEGCDLDWDALGVPYNHILDRPYSMNFVTKDGPNQPTSPDVTICGIYKRTWYALDTDGKVSDGCSQYIYSYRVEVAPVIRRNVLVECDDTADIDSLIAPRIPTLKGAGFVGLVQPASTPDSIALEPNEKVCKYIATVQRGEELPTCGNGYKQINVWTIIDWCSGTVVGDPTIQIVVVDDTVDPTTTAKGTVSFAADPFDCTGTFTAGAATGSDNCSTTLEWITSVRTAGVQGHGGSSGSIETSANTNGIVVPNIPIGDSVFVSWIAVDECDNRSIALIDTFTNTIDNRAPVAICNDALNVTLVPVGGGVQQARVYAEDLDDTSLDNCGIESMEVSRDGETYTPYLTLDCNDIDIDGIVVYLKVTDIYGNWNVCWSKIFLEDKTVAKVVPLDPINVTCLEDVPAGSVGDVTFTNVGCTAPTVVLNPDPDFSLSCGAASFDRTWKVTPADNGAHSSSEAYTVTQEINITKAPESWKITFPAQPDAIDCGDGQVVPAALTIEDFLTEDTGCDRWVLSSSDHEFVGSTATCKSVVRKYKLVNECNSLNHSGSPFNASSGQMYIASGGSIQLDGLPIRGYEGVFHFTHKFDIVDGTAPVVTFVATDTCIISDACDGGQINVKSIVVVENCGDAPVSAVLLLDAEGNTLSATATANMDGSYTFSNLDAGTYSVRVEARDGCGNAGGLTSAPLVVKADCKKPTPIGVMAFAPVMENCTVDIWTSDIETSISDNCTSAANMETAIELLTDVDMNGELDGGDVSTTLFDDPTTDYADYQSVTVTAVGVNRIALWSRDEAGNTAYSLVGFVAQDNTPGSPCSTGGGAAAAIAGKITNENNEDIDQVMVKFQSSSQSLFEQLFSGDFTYSVPMSTDLTITPEKDHGYMNGVTTADLVKLQRHILGISTLSSAYQMIAADVNSDEKVTTNDMLHISRLILGLYEELPNSTSWKFVSKDHQFANPSSPWGFPQAINYADLESDVQADFVGVKIGDLTGNASPATKLLGSDNTIVGEMTIAMDETTLTPGQATVVEFKASDFTDFAGYQFTISLGENVKLAQVTPGVLPNMTEEANFGLNRLAQGTITTSWSNANGITLEDGEVLFSLTLESTETVNLSEVISINSKQTVAEAYNNDLEAHTVGVLFNRTETAGFQLFQNQPNPFNGETMIGFNMPKAGVATLKVMNVAGQVLTTQTAEFVRGYNQIALSKSELNTSGVLYYQIETENHSATKKMVILE